MPYSKVRSDWKNFPDNTTPVTAEAIEQMEAGIEDAVAKAEEALARPAGEVTPDAIVAATTGADLDLGAATTIGGATPGAFTMDKVAGTVAFETDTPGEYLVFSGGVLSTSGGGGGGGGGFDEANVTNEWGHANVPHTNVAWPDTVGGIDAAFVTDAGSVLTGYDATAFGGKGGFKLSNDAFAADLGTNINLDTNPGWGAAYVVMEHWGINDVDADGTPRIILALQDAARSNVIRVMFMLHNTAGTKTYSWRVQIAGQSDIDIPISSLPGLDAADQHVTNATSITIVTKGASSFLSVNGAQVGSAFDLSGKVARWLDLNPHSGDGSGARGDGVYWSFGWTTSGHATSAAAQAWVADRLAAAVA